MKTQFFSTIAAALLLPLLLAVFAPALISTAKAQTNALVMTSTTLDRNAKETTSVAYLKDDKMVTVTENDKDNSPVIFDAAEETMYIINHKKKEYMEMTRQDMETMSAKLDEQLSAMEQQLQNIPEAQREMVKKQMESALGGSQKKVTEYSLEESGVAVKEWKADKYVGMADGEKMSEVYIVDYQQLGLEAEQFETLYKFFKAMKNYMQSMTKHMPSAALGFFGENMPDYKDGLPVKTIIYNSEGAPISTSTISQVEEKQVEEDLFTIPENYKKQEMSQAFME